MKTAITKADRHAYAAGREAFEAGGAFEDAPDRGTTRETYDVWFWWVAGWQDAVAEAQSSVGHKRRDAALKRVKANANRR